MIGALAKRLSLSMKILKIGLFALILFLLNVVASALVTVAFGAPNSSGDLATVYVIGFVISVCVFSYMSMTNPIKPYLTAFVVGLLAMFLNVAAAALVAGEVFWEPINLVLDIPALIVAVLVGVSIGSKLNLKRGK